MVATGLAARQGAPGGRRGALEFARGHVLGGLVGGVLMGLVLGGLAVGLDALGRERQIGRDIAYVVAFILLLDIAGYQLGNARKRLARRLQVPQEWGAWFRPGPLGFLYGLLLSLGLATPTPILLPQLLIVVGLLSHSFLVAFAMWTTYGLARTLTPSVLGLYGVSLPNVHQRIDRSLAPIRLASAGMGVLAVVTLAAS